MESRPKVGDVVNAQVAFDDMQAHPRARWTEKQSGPCAARYRKQGRTIYSEVSDYEFSDFVRSGHGLWFVRLEDVRPSMGESVDTEVANEDMKAHPEARYRSALGSTYHYRGGVRYFQHRGVGSPEVSYAQDGGPYTRLEDAKPEVKRPEIGEEVDFDRALEDMEAHPEARYQCGSSSHLAYRIKDEKLIYRDHMGEWPSLNGDEYNGHVKWTRLGDAPVVAPTLEEQVKNLRAELDRAVKDFDRERAAHADTKKKAEFHAQEAASLCALKHEVREALGVPEGAGLIEHIRNLKPSRLLAHLGDILGLDEGADVIAHIKQMKKEHAAVCDAFWPNGGDGLDDEVNVLERVAALKNGLLELARVVGTPTHRAHGEAPAGRRILPMAIDAVRKLVEENKELRRKESSNDAVSVFRASLERIAHLVGLEGPFGGAYGYEQIEAEVANAVRNDEADEPLYNRIDAALGVGENEGGTKWLLVVTEAIEALSAEVRRLRGADSMLDDHAQKRLTDIGRALGLSGSFRNEFGYKHMEERARALKTKADAAPSPGQKVVNQ
jgi:hypothetical protein